MITILAILVIIAIALLYTLWANDCHPCGTRWGHNAPEGVRSGAGNTPKHIVAHIDTAHLRDASGVMNET